MSAPPPIEPFTGKDWTECCQFIVAIRNRAREEGKLRDSEWMADLASVNLFGKALSWHVRLPQDVRANWEKLEVALMDRWSPPDSDDERAKIEPTPAAAPVANTGAQSGSAHAEPSPAAAPVANAGPQSNVPSQLRGFIKVVPYGSNDSYYTKDAAHLSELTRNRREGLLVRLDAIPGTDLFRILRNSPLCCLSLDWFGRIIGINQGSAEYAWIKDSRTTAESANDLTCTLTSTGGLIVLYRATNGSRKQLSAFTAEPLALNLAVDPVAYGKKYRDEARAVCSFLFLVLESAAVLRLPAQICSFRPFSLNLSNNGAYLWRLMSQQPADHHNALKV